jgi:hypothetical protein
MSTETQQKTEKQKIDIPSFEYFFLCPDKKQDTVFSRRRSAQDLAKTVSPFQIKDVIPMGGKNVSIFTHRLPFREPELLEIATRRKL